MLPRFKWIVETRKAAEQFWEQGGEPTSNLTLISVLGWAQATLGANALDNASFRHLLTQVVN